MSTSKSSISLMSTKLYLTLFFVRELTVWFQISFMLRTCYPRDSCGVSIATHLWANLQRNIAKKIRQRATPEENAATKDIIANDVSSFCLHLTNTASTSAMPTFPEK